jgi:hypothetical protein
MASLRPGALPRFIALLACLVSLLLMAPAAMGQPDQPDPSQAPPGQTDPSQAPDPTAPGQPALAPTPAPPKPYRPIKGAISADPVTSGPTVPGSVAQLLASGRAAAPAAAPRAVRIMIWTANRLIGLRYKWGGGHGTFSDRGYDCSGSVSYALHAAGLLAVPEDSRELMHWGGQGTGGWVTVYARNGHAFMVVAGLRLDTSPEGDPSGLDGPRWRPNLRDTHGYRARHPLAALA